MKFLKSFIRNLVVLIGVVIILALVNRWYLGGFSKLEVQETNIGWYVMAYTEFVGSYSQVGPSMDEVYGILSWAGIGSFTGVGIYYDDPAAVAPESLRSDVGAIIASEDVKKLPNDQDVKTRVVPAKQSIVIEFPLKNSVSYMAGVIKVYPALKKYMEAHEYKMEVPVTELYDMSAKKIYYVVEIVQ